MSVAIWCPDFLGRYLTTPRATSYHVTTSGLKSIHHGESEAVGGDGDVKHTIWIPIHPCSPLGKSICLRRGVWRAPILTCFNIRLLSNPGVEVVDESSLKRAADRAVEHFPPDRDVNIRKSHLQWLKPMSCFLSPCHWTKRKN